MLLVTQTSHLLQRLCCPASPPGRKITSLIHLPAVLCPLPSFDPAASEKHGHAPPDVLAEHRDVASSLGDVFHAHSI